MVKKNKLSILVIIFLATYIVLPSYFAIEISTSLPLITFSRITLVILIFSYVLQKRGVINLKIFHNKKQSLFFKIYIILLIITNLVYIPTTSEALKEIFTIIFEELLITWIITKVIDTKEKLIQALEILVYSSGIVAIIAIVSSLIGNNLFYYLNTINREMLMANYSRLGLIRAEAGFGHPVYYGVYNVIMIIIAMFLIENKSKNINYTICLILDIIALIMANSRGSLLAMIIILLYKLPTMKFSTIKKYFCFLLIFILGLSILVMLKPDIFQYIKNIYISLTNIFLSNDTEIKGYGSNSEGLESRVGQIYEVVWMFKQKKSLFGLGAAAHTRGVVKNLNSNGSWITAYTFDVGYIAILVQFGIIGFIGYLFLYGGICINLFMNKEHKKDKIKRMFKIIFVAYFLCLFSSGGVGNLFWTIFGLFCAYSNLLYNEKHNN